MSVLIAFQSLRETHDLLSRSLLYNGKTTMQAWGLIVLLVSKAVGHSPNIPEEDQDTSAGVLHTQRALAEITEMIRISFLIHQVRGGTGRIQLNGSGHLLLC